MPSRSSAPKLAIDAIIACIVEALVGFSELTAFDIDKWAVFALIAANLAPCSPLLFSMLRDQFLLLANTMVKPVLDSGRPSGHRMCPDLMTPLGLLASCLSCLIPRSQPQLAHFVALCCFHSNVVGQLDRTFACSRIRRYVNHCCIDAYDGGVFWLVSVACLPAPSSTGSTSTRTAQASAIAMSA